MHFFKILFTLFMLLTLFLSCKDDKTKTIQKTEIPDKISKKHDVKLEKMEFHIKGMTCEIGCARLIQSKLIKTKGITVAKVSFKDSIGMVEFDSNLLSHSDINNVVEKIADGTLYKVSHNKTVSNFTIAN